MKAYQLKITIQDSEPSIWRRCIVPGGITFSQFSMILNEVMGWAGYHHFKFEFDDQGVEMIEDAYDLPPHPEHELEEAATACLDSYIKKGATFCYIYDFGDYWEHEVIVEKVLDDYKFTYARVLAYEQDCPMEDAGGIDQYHYHLEVMKDPTHPEYEDRKFWAENHTYSRAYDIDSVNQVLKERLVMYRGGEKRVQQELYGEVFNQDVDIAEDGDESGLSDRMRELEDSLDKMRWEMAKQLFEDTELKDVLKAYTIPVIKDMAGQHGLRVPSAYRKKEIVDYVAKFMLDERNMRREFAYLRDCEINEFEAVMAWEGRPGWKQYKNLERLTELGYVVDTSVDIYVVPTDIAAAYRNFADQDFHKLRGEYCYFTDCLFTAASLYGVFPLSVLAQMYNQPVGKGADYTQWSENELLEELEELPAYYNNYTYDDGYIISDQLLEDEVYKKLLEIQDENSFYIPGREEICSFASEDFFAEEKNLNKLMRYIDRTLGLEEDCYEQVAICIQRIIMNGGNQEVIFEFLQEEVGAMTPAECNVIGAMLNDVWEHTRQMTLRGHTPYELNSAGAAEANADIIDLEQRRKNRKKNLE